MNDHLPGLPEALEEELHELGLDDGDDGAGGAEGAVPDGDGATT
jgi:hypothetical protein